jgi:hypothetical protein
MGFFTCPFCAYEREMPSHLFGTQYRCPKCGGLSTLTRENMFDFDREVGNAVPPDVPLPPFDAPMPARPRVLPGVAALISLLIPGGGQIVAGGLFEGLGILIGVMLLYLFFPPLGLLAHLANVVHAFTFADRGVR